MSLGYFTRLSASPSELGIVGSSLGIFCQLAVPTTDYILTYVVYVLSHTLVNPPAFVSKVVRISEDLVE